MSNFDPSQAFDLSKLARDADAAVIGGFKANSAIIKVDGQHRPALEFVFTMTNGEVRKPMYVIAEMVMPLIAVTSEFANQVQQAMNAMMRQAAGGFAPQPPQEEADPRFRQEYPSTPDEAAAAEGAGMLDTPVSSGADASPDNAQEATNE